MMMMRIIKRENTRKVMQMKTISYHYRTDAMAMAPRPGFCLVYMQSMVHMASDIPFVSQGRLFCLYSLPASSQSEPACWQGVRSLKVLDLA